MFENALKLINAITGDKVSKDTTVTINKVEVTCRSLDTTLFRRLFERVMVLVLTKIEEYDMQTRKREVK